MNESDNDDNMPIQFNWKKRQKKANIKTRERKYITYLKNFKILPPFPHSPVISPQMGNICQTFPL